MTSLEPKLGIDAVYGHSTSRLELRTLNLFPLLRSQRSVLPSACILSSLSSSFPVPLPRPLPHSSLNPRLGIREFSPRSWGRTGTSLFWLLAWKNNCRGYGVLGWGQGCPRSDSTTLTRGGFQILLLPLISKTCCSLLRNEAFKLASDHSQNRRQRWRDPAGLPPRSVSVEAVAGKIVTDLGCLESSR